MRYAVQLLVTVMLLALSLHACKEEVREVIEIEKEIDGDAEPGMIHTVYFWLDDALSAEEQGDFTRAVQQLEAIPSVKRMFVGPPAATPDREVVDHSYDLALIVWFDDVAGHELYQEHPIHLKFVSENEAKFKEVRVYDNVLATR